MLVSMWFSLVHDLVGGALGDLYRMRILKRKNQKRVNPRKHNLNLHQWCSYANSPYSEWTGYFKWPPTYMGPDFDQLDCHARAIKYFEPSPTRNESSPTQDGVQVEQVLHSHWLFGGVSTNHSYGWLGEFFLILTLTLFLITLGTMHVYKCGGRDKG